jgi:hypothetical protein
MKRPRRQKPRRRSRTRRTRAARPRLKPLTLDFEPRLTQAFGEARKMLWACYFPFLYCYGRTPGRQILYTTAADAHLLFLERETARGTQLDLIVPPLPLVRPALDLAREIIAMRRRPRPARILWVDETDAATLRSWDLEVIEKELEYLIRPSRIVGPGARPPRRLRRKLAQADEQPLRLLPWSDEHREDAWALHDRLAEEADPGLPLLDYDYTHECLAAAPRLIERGMIGLTAFSGDRLAGFAFGGPMAPGIANFFILKSDPGVPGLAEWLRVRFLERLADYPLVNDAGDLGRPGLAQHKRQFLPVRMLPAYTVRQLP